MVNSDTLWLKTNQYNANTLKTRYSGKVLGARQDHR